MKNMIWMLVYTILVSSCNKHDGPDPAGIDKAVIVYAETLTRHYLGNGVQWGGYDILEAWTGNSTHNANDWDKLFTRVQFMQPSLVRIMLDKNWNYLVNGAFNPEKSEAVLIPILDFCEQQGISVIIGEWGHTGGDTINHEWLNQSVDFLEWLLVTKNYSCIRYYNLVNEPNGDWSTIKGNYALWKELIRAFHERMTVKGIATKVKLTGPDIAVWDTGLTTWITDTRFDLGNYISCYDIHTYPTASDVRDGTYQQMIKAYQQLVPDTCPMIMGEFGFKYKQGSPLAEENKNRIDGDAFASDDSNMMIYDAFYGVDVADAMMQNMLAGYAGMILWNLDDAMYNIDGSAGTRLKRWGFWNILGSEKFGNPSDENIRPWFYPVSLMCRYFPAGTAIRAITLPDKKGLRVVAGEKDGACTLAIVNSGYVNYSIDIAFDEGNIMQHTNVYRYLAGSGSAFTAAMDANGFAAPFQRDTTLNFSNGKYHTLMVPAQSFWLYTNMP